MSSGIPQDSNFKNLSCQLGGLRLNGNISQGTAISNNIITIDDPDSAITVNSPSPTGKFIQIKVGNQKYFIPLYQ